MGQIPSKSPSLTPQHVYIAAADETKVEVAAEPANLYGFELENNGASDVFLQIFDKLAADVTVGTTTPDYTFRVPANSNFGKDSQAYPMHYHSKGITIAVTSGRANASAPAADATLQIWFSV